MLGYQFSISFYNFSIRFLKCFDGVVFVFYYPSPTPPYFFFCYKIDHFHIEVLKCDSSLHLPTNQRAKYALFVHVTVQNKILISFQPILKLPRNYCFRVNYFLHRETKCALSFFSIPVKINVLLSVTMQIVLLPIVTRP